MNSYKIKLVAFGTICSVLFGSIGLGLAHLVTDNGFPEQLRWLGTIYMLVGLPLGYILSLVLTDGVLRLLFGEAGDAASIFLYFASAFITWALIFSILRHRWLRKCEVGA